MWDFSQQPKKVINKSNKKEIYCITATQSTGSATKGFDIDVNTISSNPQVKLQALED